MHVHRAVPVVALLAALTAAPSVAAVVATAPVRVAPQRVGGALDTPLGVVRRPGGYGLFSVSHRVGASRPQGVRYTPLDLSGVPNHAAAITLAAPSTSMHDAAAVETPSGALVVWSNSGGVFALPTNSDGEPRRQEPVRIHAHSVDVTVACNLTGCLLAWLQGRGVRAVLVDEDAEIRWSADVAADTGGIGSGTLVVVPDTTGFLLLTGSENPMHATRVDGKTGAVLLRTTIPISSFRVDGDFDGRDYVLLEYAFSPVLGPRLTRVSLDGAVQETRVLGQSRPPDTSRGNAISWNGSSHLVVYVHRDWTRPFGQHVVAVRLDARLEPIGEPLTFPLPSDVATDVASAAAGGAAFALWRDSAIHAAMFRGDGTVRTIPVPAAETLSQQVYAVATSESATLTVWSETGGANELRAALSDASGRSPAPPVTLAAGAWRAGVHAAAAIGDDFLVTWQERSSITGTRDVAKAAIVRDGVNVEPIAWPDVETWGQPEVVASGGVWTVTVPSRTGLHTLRISHAGVLLTPEPATLAPGCMQTVRSAANRGRTAVFYSNRFGDSEGCDAPEGVHFLLLDDSGTAAGSPGLLRARAIDHDVVAGGDGFLTVASDPNLPTTVFVQPLDRNGTLGSRLAIRGSGRVRFVRAAPFGDGWLVTWSLDEQPLVEAAVIDRAATRILEGPFPLATSARYDLAARANGEALLLTEGIEDHPPYGRGTVGLLQQLSWRVQARRRTVGN